MPTTVSIGTWKRPVEIFSQFHIRTLQAAQRAVARSMWKVDSKRSAHAGIVALLLIWQLKNRRRAVACSFVIRSHVLSTTFM